jgi:hypothetical protein
MLDWMWIDTRPRRVRAGGVPASVVSGGSPWAGGGKVGSVIRSHATPNTSAEVATPRIR